MRAAVTFCLSVCAPLPSGDEDKALWERLDQLELEEAQSEEVERGREEGTDLGRDGPERVQNKERTAMRGGGIGGVGSRKGLSSATAGPLRIAVKHSSSAELSQSLEGTGEQVCAREVGGEGEEGEGGI